ncbi:hypothetical protein OHJ16_12350 [Actinomyces israelii]|uniref:Uncharacterized protein n=1 Tax=Actinomyces israelii TaxID=1659 RepID=A0ABT4IAQ9_9ACTO|nr:hypothetical protein [Actinomyces israelii]MCZ0858832.1 hypothetical protein [Actinomyces israelii]
MPTTNRRRPRSRSHPRPTAPAQRLHTGAAFEPANAPGATENTFEETTLLEIALAMRGKLAARGITTELAGGAAGPELHGTGAYEGMILYLDMTAFELASHDRSAWDEILDVRVAQAVTMTSSVKKPLSTPEEWRAAVRTRLVAPAKASPWGEPVQRPFAGNLVLGLYRRFSHGVAPIFPGLLEDCPLSTDELFETGQRNTDEAPLVHSGPIGAGAWALHGEGFFTASKAANLGRVLEEIDVDTSAGALFAVPHKHALGLHPVDRQDPEWALRSMALFIYDEVAQHIDPLLSAFIFYRAPDGEVEAVALPELAEVPEDGTRTILSLPAPRFDAILEAQPSSA